MKKEKSELTFSEYVAEYKKAHYKRVSLDLRKDFYEKHLQPAAKSKRMSMNSYIKEAIEEKLERENNYKRM